MAVLSAVGLFLAMLCWRRLRPGWVLALAGLIFGSLAISQNSGVQVYPDWWGALGVLALTGLILQAVKGTMRDRVTLPLIALASLLIVLMRPQNIVFLMGPAILAVSSSCAAGASPRSRWPWVSASRWAARVDSRGLPLVRRPGRPDPPGRAGAPELLGLYFALGTQMKVLNGPWYCIPPTGCSGWAMPGESVWWVAFLALAVLGLCVAWRTSSKASSVLAAATARWVIALYSFLVPFGAPRYLTPSLALMSILAADGVAWLVTKARWHRTGIVIACLFLLGGIVSQRVVLQREVVQQLPGRSFQADAAVLREAGVRPPCVVVSPSVAYYAGCMAPWTGESLPEFFARTPQGVNGWQDLFFPSLNSYVYLPSTARPGVSEARRRRAKGSVILTDVVSPRLSGRISDAVGLLSESRNNAERISR